MVSIVKENARMTVSQEDFDLIYKNTGWRIDSEATVEVPEDTSRRIKIDPSTEVVAGPTPLVLEPTKEGETILEDEHENRTKAGREKDAAKPKVDGQPNQSKNK